MSLQFIPALLNKLLIYFIANKNVVLITVCTKLYFRLSMVMYEANTVCQNIDKKQNCSAFEIAIHFLCQIFQNAFLSVSFYVPVWSWMHLNAMRVRFYLYKKKKMCSIKRGLKAKRIVSLDPTGKAQTLMEENGLLYSTNSLKAEAVHLSGCLSWHTRE